MFWRNKNILLMLIIITNKLEFMRGGLICKYELRDGKLCESDGKRSFCASAKRTIFITTNDIIINNGGIAYPALDLDRLSCL